MRRLSRLALVLIFVAYLPAQAAADTHEHGYCETPDLPALTSAPATLLRGSRAAGLRIIETVVVLPHDFFQREGEAPLTTADAIAEAKGIIAAANRHLAPLDLAVSPVEFQTFEREELDPYAAASRARSALAMLETAVERQGSYNRDDYDLVLVLARSGYGGRFGLSYPGTSCVSQRYSVAFATQGGSFPTHQHNFPYTVAHEIGHVIGMSHDDASYDDGPSIMRSTFVQDPFGFSPLSVTQATAHSGPGRVGGSCFSSSGGGAPPVARGGNEQLASPAFAVWNSFLDVTSILELGNPTENDQTVRVTLYSIDGNEEHQLELVLAARSQFDLILNELPGFIPQSYGLIRIEFADIIYGRTTYYRPGKDGRFEFVYTIPLLNSAVGASIVGFNTYRAGHNPFEAGFRMENWLTLVNLSAADQIFRVTTFQHSGKVLKVSTVRVKRFGRLDLDGGHGFAGNETAGFHEVLPVEGEAGYLALLTRYAGNGVPGFPATEYYSAMVELAHSGSDLPWHTILSTAFDQDTWIEVSNALNRRARFLVELFGENGALLNAFPYELPAHSQVHLDGASLLKAAGMSVGRAVITPQQMPDHEPALAVASMFYLRQAGSGSLLSMHTSPGRTALGAQLSGAYNLFLGAANYANLFNPNSTPLNVRLTLTVAGGFVERSYTIPANAAMVLNLHDTNDFGTAPDTYGPIAVAADAPLFGEVLRVRTAGEVDFILPVDFRQAVQ